jgi:hypothetical protein
MPSHVSLVATISVAVVAVACSGDGDTAPSAPRTVATEPASAVALVATPSGMQLTERQIKAVTAVVVRADGTRDTVPAQWTSSNPDVVLIIPRCSACTSKSDYVVAEAPGSATLTATFGALRAEIAAVVASPVISEPGDALVIDRFSMIEYRDPAAPDDWFYAPQIRAAAAPGRRALIMTMTFSIPGLDGWSPPLDCEAELTTELRDLNGEAYGDWYFEIVEAGHKASGADATAKITFVDDSNRVATRTIQGPVVRGSLPSAPSSYADQDACLFPPRPNPAALQAQDWRRFNPRLPSFRSTPSRD